LEAATIITETTTTTTSSTWLSWAEEWEDHRLFSEDSVAWADLADSAEIKDQLKFAHREKSPQAAWFRRKSKRSIFRRKWCFKNRAAPKAAAGMSNSTAKCNGEARLSII
jgi:hypothetical protein